MHRVPSDLGNWRSGDGLRASLLTLALTLLTAMWSNAILDLFLVEGDVVRVLTYSLGEARWIFLLSSAVIWLALMVLIALSGRVFLSIGLMTSFAVAFGFANLQKLRLRREPVYPSDLGFAAETGFLTDMVGVKPSVLMIASVVAITAAFVALGRLVARTYPPIRRRTRPRLWRLMVLPRLLTLCLATGSLAYVAEFNEPGNHVRGAYEAAGANWAFWSQHVNYRRHGVTAGFLYNLEGPAMAEPSDYSPERMARVAAEYSAAADRMNRNRSGSALTDLNVVVVLSEAFTDPTLIEGPTLEEDPIPFTRSLMQDTRSGEMLTQLFGGGTANMEFEALSGMSLSQFLPQMNTPYQMLVPQTPTFPSAVGYFKRQGHDAVAVHPYMNSMYKRYAAYPTLGFSDFVDESAMSAVERIDDNDFIADSAAFDQVEQQIASSADPTFINLVTMQNHYPMAKKYDDPIDASGVSGDLKDHLTHYARGLKHSDDALREFITGLEASDEKTAVIFYGDHAPAFWEGDVYDANGDDAFRRTPYFMWTNFEELPRAQEPITSPIYFLPTLLNDLDAPLPPYYALLTELHKEIPAMEQGEYFLPSGDKVTEEELPPRARELLEDYRLVQYDLAVGERYAQSEMFYPESGD